MLFQREQMAKNNLLEIRSPNYVFKCVCGCIYNNSRKRVKPRHAQPLRYFEQDIHIYDPGRCTKF